MNTINKFDGRATDYTASRPNYSMDFINCLYSQYGISKTSVIADIGSGTGKFSKHLLDRQSEVYCVEPNDDMRSIAEKELCEYENFYSVAGDAENELYLQFEPFVFRLQVFSFLKPLIYRGFSLFYIDFFKCYTNVKIA